jgi:hypothetical protein
MQSTTHAVGSRIADCLSWSFDRGSSGLRDASFSKKFHGSWGEEHSKDDERERRTNNHRYFAKFRRIAYGFDRHYKQSNGHKD